jgi:carboxypeptidase Taq
MGQNLDRLRRRLAEVKNINSANAVLSWDQHTYMPPGGAGTRAEQMATLARLAHDIFTAEETGEILDAAAEEVQGLPADSIDAALIRVARRDYDHAVRIPAPFVAALRRHAALANPVWVEARANNDYPSFAPFLEQTVQFSRELADYLGYPEQRYDALLDQYEPGMLTGQVQTLFEQLKGEVVPLVAAIAGSGVSIDDAILHRPYDEGKQERFGIQVVEQFGYDFNRGRQDRTVHPFATEFSPNDVRITTRFDPNFLNMAIFGTMHESGHAMYGQGISQEFIGTPLDGGSSLGVHESQSRLWENIVGRSRPFWSHFYPHLQQAFPQQLGTVPLSRFYAAINKVQPSLIRVEADEVTYNLHIMLRFEMELDLLEGRITAREAPDVWNEKMQEYLGIRPPSDTLGILQDTHWSGGLFGYFSTYSLGNILSVQFYEAALAAHPSIPSEIEAGRFETLRGWLTEHIYRYGRMFEPVELVERATGRPLTIDPYVSYLKTKFGELYRL